MSKASTTSQVSLSRSKSNLAEVFSGGQSVLKLGGIPLIVTTKDGSSLGSKVSNRKSRRAAKAGKKFK